MSVYRSTTLGGGINTCTLYCYSRPCVKPCVGTMIAMQSIYFKNGRFPLLLSHPFFHNWYHAEMMSLRRSYNLIEFYQKTQNLYC
jgi:hypothetical protein